VTNQKRIERPGGTRKSQDPGEGGARLLLALRDTRRATTPKASRIAGPLNSALLATRRRHHGPSHFQFPSISSVGACGVLAHE
jgi:hypothetical protein